jgi:hypothetical protein
MMNRAEISALMLSVMDDKSDGDWITRFMKKLAEKDPELYDYMIISCKVKQEEMEKNT